MSISSVLKQQAESKLRHVTVCGCGCRFPAFTSQQQAELSQAAYEIEDMMTHIRGQYELAMAAVHGQVPAASVGPYGQAAPAVGGGVPAAAPGAGGAALSGAPVMPVGGLGPIMPPSAGG